MRDCRRVIAVGLALPICFLFVIWDTRLNGEDAQARKFEEGSELRILDPQKTSAGPPATPSTCVLRQGNFLTPESARAELAAFAATYTDAKSWQRRAAAVRAGIRRGAGLETWPPRCNLKPITGEVRSYDDYTVQNIAFESLPGFFVTGNLYRPAKALGRRPALLVPHGHFKGGRFDTNVQLLCGTLARMGAVAFAYDMVGWGESKGTYPHTGAKTLALQLWNSVRSLDFLQTLPEVDSRRIGITGASGGGTQAFLLTAIDERVRVSVPVVMVSAHFFGGCTCESGMPIHQCEKHVTNNADIAALAAPRPQLLISDGKDWTRFNQTVEFPYIRNVYNLFGAGAAIENLHLADEGHDYGQSKRAAAHKFLAHHLDLLPAPPEAGIVLESPEILHVFTVAQPRPAYALVDALAIEAVLARR
jgi:uncharacterized protein